MICYLLITSCVGHGVELLNCNMIVEGGLTSIVNLQSLHVKVSKVLNLHTLLLKWIESLDT